MLASLFNCARQATKTFQNSPQSRLDRPSWPYKWPRQPKTPAKTSPRDYPKSYSLGLSWALAIKGPPRPPQDPRNTPQDIAKTPETLQRPPKTSQDPPENIPKCSPELSLDMLIWCGASGFFSSQVYVGGFLAFFWSFASSWRSWSPSCRQHGPKIGQDGPKRRQLRPTAPTCPQLGPT